MLRGADSSQTQPSSLEAWPLLAEEGEEQGLSGASLFLLVVLLLVLLELLVLLVLLELLVLLLAQLGGAHLHR